MTDEEIQRYKELAEDTNRFLDEGPCDIDRADQRALANGLLAVIRELCDFKFKLAIGYWHVCR